jgi:uncharacterized membrane protein
MDDLHRQHEMEQSMGVLLRAGVILCCAIMIVGAVMFVLRHGAEKTSYAAFHGEPNGLDTIAGVWRETRLGSARGIIQFGALLMIATPVMRVVLAVIDFARMKD